MPTPTARALFATLVALVTAAASSAQDELVRRAVDGDLEFSATFARDPGPGEVFELVLRERADDGLAFAASSDGVRTRLALRRSARGQTELLDFAEVPASASGFGLAVERELDTFRFSWTCDGEAAPCFTLDFAMVVNELAVLEHTVEGAEARGRACQDVRWPGQGPEAATMVAAPPNAERDGALSAAVPPTLPPFEVLLEEVLAATSSGQSVRANVSPADAAETPPVFPPEPSAPTLAPELELPAPMPGPLLPRPPAAESFGPGRLAEGWTFDAHGTEGSHSVSSDGLLTLSVPAGREHQCFDGLHAPVVWRALDGPATFHARFDSDVRGPRPGHRLQGLVADLGAGRFLRYELIGDGARVRASASLVDGTRLVPLGWQRASDAGPWTLTLGCHEGRLVCGLATPGAAPTVVATCGGAAYGAAGYGSSSYGPAPTGAAAPSLVPRRVGVYAGNALGADSPAHVARVGEVRLD